VVMMTQSASDYIGAVEDDSEQRGVLPDRPLKADVRNVNFHYGSHRALKNVSIPIARNRITALIGPSGCGKSTLLRCFNRMHDLYAHSRYEGEIILLPDGVNLIGPKVDAMEVRMRIGMVFQSPTRFPRAYLRTSRTACACAATKTVRRSSRRSSNPSAAPPFGKKPKTACTRPP
jgi:phosphate transport system ATP-binding protein